MQPASWAEALQTRLFGTKLTASSLSADIGYLRTFSAVRGQGIQRTFVQNAHRDPSSRSLLKKSMHQDSDLRYRLEHSRPDDE
jgi:hypothetical protein